ncbi:MAG: DUF3999 family protein [Caldimonas sp.]|uniref:DUF3999 family protein n=1 Tax=Caldimonas sp. TaxID=2838790 RepID=UPI003918A5E6
MTLLQRLAPGAAAWIWALAASAAPTAQAPLTLTAGEGLQRVEIPLDLLRASSREGWSDLQVLNAQGEAVPQAWALPPPSQERERSAPLPRFAWPDPGPGDRGDAAVQVQVDAQGAIVRIQGPATTAPEGAASGRWLLDLGPDAHRSAEWLAALELAWEVPSEGSHLRARVDASADLKQWQPVTDAALLDVPGVGAASGERLVQRRIEWPAAAPALRYLRLSLQPPARLTGVQALWRTREASAASATTPLRFEPEAGTSPPRAWSLDLGGAVPLRELRLELPQRNSVASLVLEQRADDKTPWRAVARFTAYRLDRDGQEWRSPPVRWTAPPARHWRLRLEERSPALGSGALEATAVWIPPQLVFAARGEPPFRLVAGGPVAPSLTLPQLLPGYESGQEYRLPQAVAGPVSLTQTPQSWRERLAQASAADWRRWALWAVLVLAVAALALLARRLMRDIQSS